MARKTNKETAKVATVEAVVIEERPAPKPEYIPKECIYALLVNDRVEYKDGQPAEIVGNWYTVYVDTRQESTCFGPYKLFDAQGQPLVGFVPVEMLKPVVRKMWADNLGSYSITPFPLMSTGIKIMSCLVFD